MAQNYPELYSMLAGRQWRLQQAAEGGASVSSVSVEAEEERPPAADAGSLDPSEMAAAAAAAATAALTKVKAGVDDATKAVAAVASSPAKGDPPVEVAEPQVEAASKSPRKMGGRRSASYPFVVAAVHVSRTVTSLLLLDPVEVGGETAAAVQPSAVSGSNLLAAAGVETAAPAVEADAGGRGHCQSGQ
jgi:hypothetical protein